MLTGQRSTWTGSKLGRSGLDTGWIWAGLGPPRVAQGGRPHGSVWALSGSVLVVLVHGRPRSVGLWTVEWVRGRPHPCGCSWVRCTVHPMYEWAVQGRDSPPSPSGVLPPVACLAGKPRRRRWCAIDVGESSAEPRRTRWWDLGGGQGFPERRPRWSAAWRGGARWCGMVRLWWWPRACLVGRVSFLWLQRTGRASQGGGRRS